ncbi:hypothetical protein D3C87_1415030 [compost metagenome]
MVTGDVNDMHGLVLCKRRLNTLADNLDQYAHHLGVSAVCVQVVAATGCHSRHGVVMGCIPKVYDGAALGARCCLYKRSHCAAVHTFGDAQIPALAALLGPDVLSDVWIPDWITSHQIWQVFAGIRTRHENRQILLQRLACLDHHFVTTVVIR